MSRTCQSGGRHRPSGRAAGLQGGTLLMYPPLMPAPLLFLPQEKLDVWTAEGRIEIGENTLEVPDTGGLDLTPALRFTGEVGGEGDSAGLVGKVRTLEEVAELGADHYRDSVILGDAAYEVIEGFLARTREAAGAPAQPGKAADAEPAEKADAEPAEKAGAESPEDDLAKLLLEKL